MFISFGIAKSVYSCSQRSTADIESVMAFVVEE
jgi:hypothetical protein